MAPTIPAQHVVAVTVPIAVLFFTYYLWYKKRSNSISRSRNDPGGGGGTSKKRSRHRNTTSTTMAAATTTTLPSTIATGSTGPVLEQEIFPEAMKNAMQKVIRDLETASPIQEICSDTEESQQPREMENSTLQSPVTVKEYFNTQTETAYMQKNNNGTSIIEKADSDGIGKCRNELMVQTAKNGLQKEAVEEGEESVEFCSSNSVVAAANSSCCASYAKSTTGEHDVSDNLDVAMQKLESMRLTDNPKHKKSSSNNTKRKNHLSIDTELSNNDTSNSTNNRAKSPPSALTQSTSSSPPSSSKARKRKSKRKRSNAHQASNTGEEETACKVQDSEETQVASAKKTCDSNNKTNDTCVGRTSTSNTKNTRKCPADNETRYISSRESDMLSCKLTKSDERVLKVIENHHEDCDNERDSANHSPVDTILDCQSVQFSDAHSEGSSDSGKGCSEGAVSPSPQTPAGGSSISGDQNTPLLYQFVIPQDHVGKLIGKRGQFINSIKSESNTRIYIKKHPTSFKKKLCALEGVQADINKALELIRNRFPEDVFPDISLDEFPLTQPIACPLRSDLFQLDLIEGVNNDVVISSLVTAGHLFLQQPMHPTYQSLTYLNLRMNQVYNSPEAPLVLKPVKDNIVAAPAMGGWYRAQITAVNSETETCDVRFLDYGGYLNLSTTCLRAVRADFLTLPFQAVECVLAHIAPINDAWCENAKLVVQGLTYGQILQAQVYDYTPDGIALILLYAVHGSQVILINDELVARGFAYATGPSEGGQLEEYYVYS